MTATATSVSWKLASGPSTSSRAANVWRASKLRRKSRQTNGYNVFRWYRSGWGRYSQADPIALKGGLNLYSYSLGNPTRMIDPLGLRVRVCCKAIPATLYAAAGVYAVTGILPESKRHCYFEFDMGPFETVGVHWAGENTAGATDVVDAMNCNSFGYIHPDHDFDLDKTNPSTCGPWTACGEECIRNHIANYTNPSRYCLFGPNSNTFVGSGTRKCGLTPPPGETANAPGWNDSEP